MWTFGKLRSFEKLFKSYWFKVYDMCCYYLKETEMAKDLTQNIFLDLWERRVNFESRVDMEKYLTRCSKFQVLNYFRYARRIELLALEDMPEQHTADYLRPDLQMQYKEIEERIERQMQKLSEPARTVFYLSRREYLSYKQIAERLGISTSTVEYHISNSLRTLRRELL
ncbi:MAG: RNA polymerase sigma-70 factor [Sphingobacterium sp.]|jgi:RNA polymerase sigma-70 factor (ECF subfamily)|uniref:RNA polymerase sigma-70 factor n=1 Tax=unclassified Sphingobacterium TaxID=2609468 RepID=UPI002842DEBF|nr:RNA polymerase sigma-70 factor [Sphingobacterium sp.]MDR3007242.1 RNA polymerase sigma-70 factor [Sphingobacterium sp.]